MWAGSRTAIALHQLATFSLKGRDPVYRTKTLRDDLRPKTERGTRNPKRSVARKRSGPRQMFATRN